ncbi:MAG: leucine-rich repeat domain-containing protein, partial [Bacteroidales bacterium]|nr:leucine-rich repeat domain-containing protein [Bacteroidales bacterium]
VILPSSVETIGEEAFSGCSLLTDITWSDNLKSIQPNAFSSCGFDRISLPEGLEELCYDAFGGCVLTEVTLPSSIVKIGGGPEYDSSAPVGSPFSMCLRLQKFNGKFATPDNKALVAPFDRGSYMVGFASSGLERYQIPEVYGIAVNTCTNTKIKEFIFPECLTAIDDYAFGFCSYLTSLTLPASLGYIGSAAFYGCSKLESITLQSRSIPEPTTSGRTDFWCPLGRFFDSTNNCPIYVPSNLVEQYKTADIWTNYASRFVSM